MRKLIFLAKASNLNSIPVGLGRPNPTVTPPDPGTTVVPERPVPIPRIEVPKDDYQPSIFGPQPKKE